MKLLDPRNELGSPVEDELVESRDRSIAAFPASLPPERSILVAAQTDAALSTLRELAEPLARSLPPRELILARLVQPPRAAGVRGGLQTENLHLERASHAINQVRERLAADKVAARGVALTSSSPAGTWSTSSSVSRSTWC